MDLTVNPKVDLSDTAPLLFGGVAFRLAPLVFRQIARVGPLLPDVLATFNRRFSAVAGFNLGADGRPLLDDPAEVDASLRALSLNEAESRILLDVVHIGLTRVYPRLTLDDLLDLPATFDELLTAANAVISASGTAKKADGASPGEAVATSR